MQALPIHASSADVNWLARAELGGLILRSRTQAVKKMTSTWVWNIFLGVEMVENSKTDLRSGKSVNAPRKNLALLNVPLR
jgi:hypothetical protein